MLYRFRKAAGERPKMGKRKQKLRNGRDKFKKQVKSIIQESRYIYNKAGNPSQGNLLRRKSEVGNRSKNGERGRRL